MCAMSVTTDEPLRAVDDRREGRAVGWLTAGLLLGPIGLTIGWYHVLTAPRWSWSDKVLAALLPAPLAGIVLVFRADLDAETCRTSVVSSATCLSQPAGAIMTWSAAALLGSVLGWLMVHLRRSARTGRTHRVAHRAVALVLAIAAATVAPGLVERFEDSWSHPERDAVIDIAAQSDGSGERYEVIDEQTATAWGSGERPNEQRVEQVAGPGNLRFAALYESLARQKFGDAGEAELTASDRGSCHVFPYVRGGYERRIEHVVGLMRLCYGPSESTSSFTLDGR
jgi:hypothetical protein